VISAVFALLVLVIALAAATQIRTDPRITQEFRRNSYIALVGYVVFSGVGLLVLFALVRGPGGDLTAFAGAGFMLSWIALGTLWLIRLAPRLRQPPGLLLRAWGVLDWLLIALALGLAAFLAIE
jgi:hypothetical protein